MADEYQFLDYEGMKSFKSGLNGVDIVTATGNGAAYTATIPHLTALKRGMVITIVPDTTSTVTIPTLNLNGLGAKNIKQRLSVNTSLTAEAAADSWMIANKPVPLIYDGSQWVTITGRPSASSLYGSVPIANGGTGATDAAAARENLGITPANIGAASNAQMQKALCNANFATDYSTVLEACLNVPDAGGSFFAVVGSALAAAEDSAWKDSEVQYLVLRDDVGGPRKTVLAIRYASTCRIKFRTLFSNSWLGDDWVSVDDSSMVLPISRGGTGATDKVTALYNLGLACFGIANGIDVDTATNSGFYKLEGVHPNIPTDSNGVAKCKYGQMIVAHGAGDTVAQMAFDYTNATPFVRSGNPPAVGGSGEWGKWRPLLSQILDDSLYGDTLPPTGETGQIYFLQA